MKKKTMLSSYQPKSSQFQAITIKFSERYICSDVVALGNAKQQVVCDSEGNRFRVRGFTYNRQGAINGFYLMGERGNKEIALSDARFYKKCRRKGK